MTDGVSTVVKYHEKDNYTIIPNHVFEDESISYKAKGLLCRILSKPGAWKFRLREFASKGKDGEESIRSGVQELLDVGYAEEVWTKRPDGMPEKLWRFSSRKEFAKTESSQNRILPEWQDTVLVRTETTSKNNSPAAQDAPQVHGTIQSMVMAYFDGLQKSGRVVNTKNFPRHVKAAKNGLTLGFTPEQVMASTMELSRQPFWADKMVPLEKVVERLQSQPVTIRKPAVQSEPTTFIDPFGV